VGQFIKRKEAEEGLEIISRRLSNVVSHAPVVLFAVDGKGRFTLSEGRGLAAQGREPGQVVGRSVFEVYRDVPRLQEHVRRALKGESFTDSVELPVQKLCYETRYTPVLGPGGEVVEVIGVAVDVTERSKEAPSEKGGSAKITMAADAAEAPAETAGEAS